MIVQSSSIGMESARTYSSVSMEAGTKGNLGNVKSFFEALSGSGDGLNEKKGVSTQDDETKEVDKKELGAKNDFDNIFNKMRAFATSSAFEEKMERDATEKIRVRCIQYLLMILFGRKEDYDEYENTTDSPLPIQSVGGDVTTYSYLYSESEETSFSTQGTVVTSDGRQIDFNLELSMSRSFSEHYEESYPSSDVIFSDPLVINLDYPMAEVSDVKVRFDLDSDGAKEEIGALSKSSGYLSLDINKDGIINDGSELFGTKSGDGFSDLAKYDSDNNGWIDEADEIFDKLTICFLSEDGTQELYKLKDKGVGAIFLGNSQTDFSLNDLSTNKANARIRKTGIFLYESGGVGTIQNLDLAQ